MKTINTFSIIFIILLMFLLFLVITSPVGKIIAKNNINYKIGNNIRTIPSNIFFDNNPIILKSKILNEMKSLLKDVIDVLDKNNITYWTVCGTFIGVHRHKGFIPWDDDIDLAILYNDVPKLLKIKSYLDSQDYQIFTRGGAYKIARKGFIPFPFIDLIVMNEQDNQLKLCYPLNFEGNCTYEKSLEWPKEVYDTNRVFPLKKMIFEDFMINVPKDDTLLEETYKNCKTIAFHDKLLSKINNHYTYALLWKLGINHWF